MPITMGVLYTYMYWFLLFFWGGGGGSGINFFFVNWLWINSICWGQIPENESRVQKILKFRSSKGDFKHVFKTIAVLAILNMYYAEIFAIMDTNIESTTEITVM